MVAVDITPEEERMLALLAAERQNNKHPLAVDKQFSDRYTGEGIHTLGLMGELAVAKWAGTGIDERILAGGDGGVDLVIGSSTVDVKTRDREGRDLAFYPDLSDMRADKAILTWRHTKKPNRIVLVGWVDESRINSVGYLTEFIPGKPRLVVDWRYMYPMWLMR